VQVSEQVARSGQAAPASATREVSEVWAGSALHSSASAGTEASAREALETEASAGTAWGVLAG